MSITSSLSIRVKFFQTSSSLVLKVKVNKAEAY